MASANASHLEITGIFRQNCVTVLKVGLYSKRNWM